MYTTHMSKRLQVVLDEREFRDLRQTARSHGMTVAEWVRRSLKAARQQEPSKSSREKIEAVRRAIRGDFPTGDIAEMLGQIEAGYLGPQR